MKILVTGRHGQVAQSLIERAQGRPDLIVEAVGRPDLDLEIPETVTREIITRRPDIVVSAAAYTAVDAAEDEPDRAMAVNATGAGAVAGAAAQLGVPVIHLSTDYVFSGGGSEPHGEDDPTAPATVYGKTKLAGEQAIAEANPRHIILRTAWLYSPFGRNFVKTMLDLAAERSSIDVVGDQWGNPTSALDLAEAILRIVIHMRDVPQRHRYGLFHCAGTGSTNWSGFAEHIFAESRALGGPHAEIRRVTTSAYRSPTKRPSNSRLSSKKLEQIYGWVAPDWRVSSADVVRQLLTD